MKIVCFNLIFCCRTDMDIVIDDDRCDILIIYEINLFIIDHLQTVSLQEQL
jgi:hypothetical protein